MEELIKACSKGNLSLVKYLLENGADIHVFDNEALRSASYHGHLDIVKYLVKRGANIKSCHYLPLKYAAEKGYLDMVKYFMENGVSSNNAGVPLILASANGHLDIVKYLIKKGVDVNTDNGGALKWSLINSAHLEVASYLRSVYINIYKEKFICYNCLVLPCCTKLCSNNLIKEKCSNKKR